jgi:hypothetical protein
MLSKNILHHLTVYVGEPEPSSLVFVRKPFMINAHQVHQRCLKIVDMHGILHNIVTEVIRFSISDPRFHPGSRHPHGKTTRMVVATVVVGQQLAL